MNVEKQTATPLQSPADRIDEKEILQKYDRESRLRELHGPLAIGITTICVIWCLWQLYTAAFGVFPPTIQRACHLGFALFLGYLLFPAYHGMKDKDRVRWYDFLLAGLSVVVAGYHVVNYLPLINRAGMYNQTDMLISVLAMLLIIEAARRVVGPVITVLGCAMLLYAYFGNHFPGFFGHPGFGINRISTSQWLSTEGILSTPMDVSSTFIFLFLIFAAFLKKTGIGDWMTNICIGLTGGMTGGPAKASVIASACQGTISGSSVANVAGTGSVTIPLMKRIGYSPEFAGAVEAAASTGGQIMPPIMGAAAFIMAEFIGVPYWRIAVSAIVPAFLYFTGVMIGVHFEAKRTGLKGLPKDQLPQWKQLLVKKWFLIVPLVGLVGVLAMGYTALMAGLIGTGLIVVISMILPETRLTPRKLIETLEEGARSAIPVALACAMAGVIVGVVTLTGLGMKMGSIIVSAAGSSVFLTMFYTMICSLILGMGVPTTANYIIQATISAPALILVGIHPLAAHFFVFYFGIVSDITPPVALAAFAGSGIAGSNPMKTAVNATKLGIAAFVVPYIFALSPALILVDATPWSMALALVTALLGMFGLGAGTAGYLLSPASWWQRIALLGSGLLMIIPGLSTDLIGFVIFAGIFLIQKKGLSASQKIL